MRALIDRHHGDLFFSLQLLFDRLGVEVYTPVGGEWWLENYWSFGRWAYGDDRLAGQFLVGPYGQRDERGDVYDPAHPERPIHTVTLDEARTMDWDYVAASVDDNEVGFHRFAREMGAQYVLQAGNTRQRINWALDPLALVSSEMPILGRGVRYHQEFESGPGQDFEVCPPWPRSNVGVISSYVNLMPLIDCGPLMGYYRAALQGFTWHVHGIECPDGIVQPARALGWGMAGSQFGWHDKITGDGFGHVIHGWAAVGRPLIGHASHYAGQMAEPFWDDLVTCIDLDKRSFDENVRLIREISQDADRHAEMCRAIRTTFDRLVDYEAEAAAIASLLGIREAVAA